jgi:hypothetical protein
MMVAGFGYGLRRAIVEVIGGFVMSTITDAIIGSGAISPEFGLVFGLLNMILTICFVLVVPYWGTVYLVGWLFGLSIMLQTGLLGVLDAVIYFGVPLVVLVLRIWKKLSEQW